MPRADQRVTAWVNAGRGKGTYADSRGRRLINAVRSNSCVGRRGKDQAGRMPCVTFEPILRRNCLKELPHSGLKARTYNIAHTRRKVACPLGHVMLSASVGIGRGPPLTKSKTPQETNQHAKVTPLERGKADTKRRSASNVALRDSQQSKAHNRRPSCQTRRRHQD